MGLFFMGGKVGKLPNFFGKAVNYVLIQKILLDFSAIFLVKKSTCA